MNPICPFCDSNEVEKIEIKESFPIPFCGDVVIPHPTFRCHSCGEEGDFDHSLDKDLTVSIDIANNESAAKLMDELSRDGITMTYFEKALRLPFRTTARWRKGKISHSSLALLRIIRSSPSLLEVADNNFSSYAIERYHLSRTWDFFKRNTNNPGYICSYDHNQGELGISYTGNVQSNPLPSINKLCWEIK